MELVEGAGFEPAKAEPADLQSAPFSHSGTPPYKPLELAMGFEPATCGLQNRCSAVELRQQIIGLFPVTEMIIPQRLSNVNAQESNNTKRLPKQIDNRQMRLM